MSKKFVLIPLRTFTDLCSSVKRQGDTITGTVKSFTEDEPKKQKKKGQWLLNFCFNFLNFIKRQTKRAKSQEKKD